MLRLGFLLLALLLAGCSRERAPERPDPTANERLDSIEARLDAAEAADPVVAVAETAAPAVLD